MRVTRPRTQKARFEVFPQTRQVRTGVGRDHVTEAPVEETKYYVRLRARNSKVLMTSEDYDSDGNAIKAAKVIRMTVMGALVDDTHLPIHLLDEKGRLVRKVKPRSETL